MRAPRLSGTLAAAGTSSLMLAGWGVRRWRWYFAEPARTAALVEASVVAGLAAPMFHLGGRARREDRAQALLAPAYLVASSTGMVLMPYLDARPDLATFAKLPGRTGRWLGVALVGLGCAVQVWAMRSLGPWFIPRVAILEDHDLVQAGPYRFVRHPFYAGLVSASLGLPLAFGLWTGVPAVAVSVPLLLNRITAEERLLAEEFGEAFTELTTRTWRLVPYVY